MRPPSLNLGLVVIIPARKETGLLNTLMSLSKCTLPPCDVEVIAVMSGSRKDSEALRAEQFRIVEQVRSWAEKLQEHSRLKFHILEQYDLPPRHADVELARKIGMDEACYRLEKAGAPHGVLACLDSGSRCDKSYFTELDAFFKKNPDIQGCDIYFEYPLEGVDFPDEVYRDNAFHELHLRYLVQTQQAFQKVSSAVAIRADAYQEQGGMNDLQVNGVVKALNATRVIPSPRLDLAKRKGFPDVDLVSAVKGMFQELGWEAKGEGIKGLLLAMRKEVRKGG